MTDLTRDPAYPERPYPEVTRGGGVPHVEVLSRGPASPSVRTPLRRSARFKIFSAVFLLVLAAGSLWNFTRPAVYRATATVLVEAPEGIGFRAGEDGHDLQNVAVQGRVLLAQELLQDTLARAGASGGAVPLDPDGLRTLLSVRPTPDTNLVELDATGGDPELLARLVNAWTEAYLALRQRQVATDVDESLTRLQEEYDRLDASKREKAEALDAYRERHEIATMERDGNSALARLNALTESLNKARAEALEAESRYAALEEAIARGEPVVPQSEQGELMGLERQAAELRLKLEGLAKRYTPMYMQNSPNLRELPAELADLDQRIERMKTEGREFQRSVVRRDIERTRRQVELQEQQMRVAREEASRFTARYARYETMKQDLEAVDDLHRELEARLVDVKTKAPERYQQVEVVEPAFPPQRPIQPDYWRDLAYTLVGAGASALLAVLLMEFLGRRTRDEDEELPLTGVRVFPGASGTATAPALAVPTPGPIDRAPGTWGAERRGGPEPAQRDPARAAGGRGARPDRAGRPRQRPAHRADPGRSHHRGVRRPRTGRPRPGDRDAAGAGAGQGAGPRARPAGTAARPPTAPPVARGPGGQRCGRARRAHRAPGPRRRALAPGGDRHRLPAPHLHLLAGAPGRPTHRDRAHHRPGPGGGAQPLRGVPPLRPGKAARRSRSRLSRLRRVGLSPLRAMATSPGPAQRRFGLHPVLG